MGAHFLAGLGRSKDPDDGQFGSRLLLLFSIDLAIVNG